MTTFLRERPYTLVLAAMACLAAPAGAQLKFDGNGGDQIPVRVGDLTTLEIVGPPQMNFALFGGNASADFSTPIGMLGIDIYDPSFAVGINGLTFGSPTFNLGWTDSNGVAAFNFVPFPANSPVGEELFGQVAMADPTSIFGVTLYQRAGVIATPTVPEIESVSPHSAVLGQPVTIIGSNLGGASNNGVAPAVTLGDVTVPVDYHDESMIQVTIPPGATSGPLVVTTSGGTSSITEDGWGSWVSVYPGVLTGETLVGNSTLAGPHTIIGDIVNQQDVDVYHFAVNAGEEIHCEVQTYDPTIVDIKRHDPADFYGGGINPYVSIGIQGYPLDYLRSDDDGGPLFAATIGVAQGPRFVAPLTGTVDVTVQSRYQFTFGKYVLNFWTEPTSAGEPPELLLVHPNLAPPGSAVEVLAWGMMPLAQPAAVIFPGPNQTTIEVVPYQDEDGKLLVQIPLNAWSGPLRVKNSTGLVSQVAVETYPQFLMIQRNGALESTVSTVTDDEQVLGSIAGLFEADTYLVNLAAGDELHLHCAPFDLVAMRLLKGQSFVAGLLDPHLVIRDPVSGTIYRSDNNGGPGTSAMIGGMLGNPFVAPVTQQYEVVVRGFLTISTGPYILDVQID